MSFWLRVFRWAKFAREKTLEKEFWLARWERDETGFHQDEYNPYLRKYWPELRLASDSTVFVPLCGKSRDMQWLNQAGHHVLGVELSPIAVRSFFNEHGHRPRSVNRGKFDEFEADGIRILCGDMFDLEKCDLEKVTAMYDRASLIAFPPDMRERYVGHLTSVLPPATRVLLITVEYPQPEMAGPPFSVSAEEVESLFGQHAKLDLLSCADVLAENPRFQQRGLSQLVENIFLLELH